MNQRARRARKTVHTLGDSLKEMSDAAVDRYSKVRDGTVDLYERGHKAARQWTEAAEEFITEKPVRAVLLAAGCGLFFGFLYGRLKAGKAARLRAESRAAAEHF